MRYKHFLSSVIFTVMSTMVVFAAPALAATQPSSTSNSGGGNAIQVSPVRSDLTINPGASQTVTVYVKNVTTASATYQALINDFVAGNNENGQPNLLLDPGQYAPTHSLKRYIAPIPNVTVAAGENKAVPVVISVPKNAAGGGYFGAVRFAPVGSANGNQNVSLSASVGSLLLVKVPGDITENLSLVSFDSRSTADSNSASSFYTSNNSIYAVVRFQNKRNVQEQPFGKVILKKGSTVLQSTEINNADPKGNVLPSSIRRFSVKLDKVGTWGKYTVEGNFGYGSKGQLLTASSTFYVFPVALIVAAVIALVVIIAALILIPRMIKRYNQGILRRAGRR